MIDGKRAAALGTGGSNGSASGAAVLGQSTREPGASSTAFDAEVSAALDTIADDLDALDRVTRLIWRGARRGGPLARVAAETIRGMADLAMRRAAIEQEAGLP